MRKYLLAGLLAGLLLLSGCAGGEASGGEEAGTLHVLATTYPVYLFAGAVTEGVDGVEVSLLVNQPTSCLHDYTLTVTDMKAVAGADVVVLNGVGLEEFMADALAQSDAAVVDCSEGIGLLSAGGHGDHDHHGHGEHGHEEEYDPHIWMDPDRAAQMVENICSGLSDLDGAHAQAYQSNALSACASLAALKTELRELTAPGDPAGSLSCREFITFHDGFQYFAEAFGLDLVKSVEEEEGATASAAEIKEITALIRERRIPAIFTEVNGSDATAGAIGRETGVELGQLTMLMSGEGSGLEVYLDGIRKNVETAVNLLSDGKIIVS